VRECLVCGQARDVAVCTSLDVNQLPRGKRKFEKGITFLQASSTLPLLCEPHALHGCCHHTHKWKHAAVNGWLADLPVCVVPRVAWGVLWTEKLLERVPQQLECLPPLNTRKVSHCELVDVDACTCWLVEREKGRKMGSMRVHRGWTRVRTPVWHCATAGP
jgi:hypothetical protein